jgi:hypothetical protein
MLGNSRSLEGIGQLVSGMGKPHDLCACGATIRDCPFWQAVRAGVAAEGIPWQEAVGASVRQAHVGRFWRTWRAGPEDPDMRRLAAITDAVARAVARVSGKPHVLDSSKEPTRALFLAKYVPEARFLRLVRDPRSAVASHYWRLKEWHYFHFLRRDWHYPRLAPFFLVLAAASWTVGNLSARSPCATPPPPRVRAALRGPARTGRSRRSEASPRPSASNSPTSSSTSSVAGSSAPAMSSAATACATSAGSASIPARSEPVPDCLAGSRW